MTDTSSINEVTEAPIPQAPAKLTTREILVGAKALLVDKGWTQRDYARGADGYYSDEEGASCFCGWGALLASAVPGDMFSREAFKASAAPLKALEAVLGEGSPRWVPFNDTPGRTLPEVLEVFDRAIAACGPEEVAA